ncbi:hypothetical protein DEU56DRAFT_773232 [Suillus clintonianus]|uniref:uncharacterized protein n=1 Tax=Suillus clintonianus TaxID=1904413 RepID=UPI001B87F984|nr:uncharacterized protein DEU56DRAFT_773232 [Suillus clintonianus]KAG2153137.1 hypothetical protein DEU56DRAFT_773232 [Suillus clintonianus]
MFWLMLLRRRPNLLAETLPCIGLPTSSIPALNPTVSFFSVSSFPLVHCCYLVHENSHFSLCLLTFSSLLHPPRII